MIDGAGGGSRTLTRDNPRRILSPVRLPIPPLRLTIIKRHYNKRYSFCQELKKIGLATDKHGQTQRNRDKKISPVENLKIPGKLNYFRWALLLPEILGNFL